MADHQGQDQVNEGGRVHLGDTCHISRENQPSLLPFAAKALSDCFDCHTNSPASLASGESNQSQIRSQHLCSICQEIDFDRIIAQSVEKRGRVHVIHLAENFSMQRDTSCSFCNLLWHILLPEKKGQPDTTLDVVLCRDRFPLSYKYDYPHFTIDQSYEGETGEWLDSIETRTTRMGRIVELSSAIPGIRALNASHIDSTVLQGWIHWCQSKHNESCSAIHVNTESPITLIDCATRRLVPEILAVTCVSFVALSYVWGSSQVQSQDAIKSDQLPDHLPPTVEDAITVTRNLGFNYLWIDRYCIRQDDENDKIRQIPVMGLIYQLAEVTIIAAAGHDPTYGLPGVGAKPRNPQPRAVIGGRTLVWDLGDPKAQIKRSTWMTRGWTYQEAILSRRRLIFTDQQTYFECHDMYCCEAQDGTLGKASKRAGLETHYLFPKGRVGHSLDDFGLRVSEYFRRTLGQQSDIINAFQGILREFRNLETPIYDLWGIPILPQRLRSQTIESSSDCFLAGLCWYQTSPANRRPGFPSWSWVGWQSGNVHLSSTYDWGTRSGITVSLESTTGRSIGWTEFESNLCRQEDQTITTGIITLGCWTLVVEIEYLVNRYFDTENPALYVKIHYSEGIKHERFHPSNKMDESRFHGWPNRHLLGIYLGPLYQDLAGEFCFLLIVEKVQDVWERIGYADVCLWTRGVSSNEYIGTARQLLPLINREMRLG